jgi:hypothetical protein
MNANRIINLATVVALCLTCLALAATAMPLRTAQADLGSGLSGKALAPQTLESGSRYTVTSRFTPSAYVGDYGAVQIMAANSVTASQVLTITPQFSIQDGLCTASTLWFTSTSYLPYQPYSIVSNQTTVTESVGNFNTAPLSDQFTATGSDIVGREVSVQGRCLRLKLDWSNPGQAYTPTILIRALNRN